MSFKLLHSMYCLLNGTFPMGTIEFNHQNNRKIPDWMNLSKPPLTSTNSANVWRQVSNFDNLQIKPSLCGHTSTELISIVDFDENTLCCSLFLIFGGRSSEIRDGSCHVDDERALYLIEMVDNEFSTCLSYIYNNGDVNLLLEKSPKPRYGHTSVFDKDKMLMYVFGGKSAGRCLNDLAIFDIETSLWTVVDFATIGCVYIPQERYGHSCVMHKNWMIVCGGMDKDGQIIDGIQALDMNTCRWINIQVENSLSGRCYFTMDIMERRENEIEIIIAGGIRKDYNEKPIQRLIIHDHERTLLYSTIPIENKDWDKYGHCSVLKNQTLLLVGGMNQDHTFDCSSLEYCIESGKFSSFSYFQIPSTHCRLPFLNISQDVMKTNDKAFHFATLLYDSTLNCYVVGGNSTSFRTQPATENQFSFKDLYEDTLTKVATFMNYEDLKSFSLLSKKYYTASCSDIIWKPILNQLSCKSEKTIQDHNYKKQFQWLVQRKKSLLLDKQEQQPIRKWSIKREYYKRSKDFISPSITCPTRTINISIRGDDIMVRNFIDRLNGERVSSYDTIHSIQFYYENCIFHLVMDTKTISKDTDLLIICIGLLEKHTIKYISSLEKYEITPATLVLGLQEEKYKTLVFKKSYGTAIIPVFIRNDSLILACQSLESLVAFEAISTVTGYGMYQLLEYFLHIINMRNEKQNSVCNLN